MKIAIDLRSLSSGSISGVENYIVNLLEHMVAIDRDNQYLLFYNSWKPRDFDNLHFANSEIKQTRMPNKLLNALLKLNVTKLEKLTGAIDVLFMPNLNQFSLWPKTKLALTVHDMSPVVTPEFYDWKRRAWHKFLNYKKAFDRANILFTVSDYTKYDIMRLFNVPSHKITVTYPGVLPANEFTSDVLRAFRNESGLPGRYLLFLSTIEPRKNLGNLIKAFEMLEDPAHLVIAGKKGWKYRNIFDQIRQSKKSDKIHYIGYLSETDKPKLITLARAVAYPSFYEGFGFVPVEAMAHSVPVVASSVTAIPEVVQDCALQVNPYNISEIVFSLEEILNNNPLREILISKGKIRSQEFTWEKTARGVLAGLNSLQ